MKRNIAKTVVIILIITMLASCKYEPDNVPAIENTPTDLISEIDINSESDINLDELLNSYNSHPVSMDNFEFETNGQGFPLELLNELKKAVYMGESDSFIHEMNDKSLMITENDFVFAPNESDDITFVEKKLNNYFTNKDSEFYFYKCDITGDGNDEIIIVENQEYIYSHSNTAYLLKKHGDNYVFDGYDYLGYYRCFAIFRYENKFYLIANFDDYQTGITKAVGLFDLSGNNTSGFMWLIDKNEIYIRKTNDTYTYNFLYRNKEAAIIDDVQSYIDSISIDLIYTERVHKTFYGNEIERNDLLESGRENDKNNNLMLWNMYSIDVNNDGQDEFFDRKILYNGGSDITGSSIRWHDLVTYSIYAAPFTSWNPEQYYLTQMWFKVINGKTIIFSLYHKNNKDIYLLDARMCENTQTTILLDYVITLNSNVELSEYWDYKSDTNYIKTEYNDPDSGKAFPDNAHYLIDSFAVQVQGGFVPVNHKDENIPNDLIVVLEKALFDKNIYNLDLGSAFFEINKDDFYNKHGSLYFNSKNEFDRYVNYIYEYNLNNDIYFLLVIDDGGSARFASVSIYKKTDRDLVHIDGFGTLDQRARVIRYNDSLYLIEVSYNYYSKFTDTVRIYKLTPDGAKNYVSIELIPEKYTWQNIYNNEKPYEKEITDYVNSIKDDLMEKSPINDNIEIYIGDETESFDRDKLFRLKSVSGDRHFYEVDFNNDGIAEYIDKRFWFPSNYTTLYLINNVYRFTDKRIISTDSSFAGNGETLVQLWFREIDGKIFTFRLFLSYDYNYLLNVSLIENTDITQVQSYIIVPEIEFSIESGIKTSAQR